MKGLLSLLLAMLLEVIQHIQHRIHKRDAPKISCFLPQGDLVNCPHGWTDRVFQGQTNQPTWLSISVVSPTLIEQNPNLPHLNPSGTQQTPIHIPGLLLQKRIILIMLRMDREHIPLDPPSSTGYIHQYLPTQDPKSDHSPPARVHPCGVRLFDSFDNIPNHQLGVRSPVRRVGAVDCSLDDGVLVADSFDQGGVGGGITFYDGEAGVGADFEGKFGGVAEEGSHGVVFGKAGGECGGANASCEVGQPVFW